MNTSVLPTAGTWERACDIPGLTTSATRKYFVSRQSTGIYSYFSPVHYYFIQIESHFSQIYSYLHQIYPTLDLIYYYFHEICSYFGDCLFSDAWDECTVILSRVYSYFGQFTNGKCKKLMFYTKHLFVLAKHKHTHTKKQGKNERKQESKGKKTDNTR